MPNLYDPSHLLEATSWVHDLRRCVTTRSAALELGITRRAAAALLADLPANEQGGSAGAKYEVHYSRVVRDEAASAEKGSCTTSVKLVKEVVTAGQTSLPGGTIYSIALLPNPNGAPSVQSAHEHTKSMLRDMVLGDEHDEACGGALDTDVLTDDVRPDERIQELLSRSDYDAMRLRRIAATLPKGVEANLMGGGGTGGGFGSGKPAMMAKKKPAAPARKATSAASFFGASSGSGSTGGSSKPPTSSKPKPTANNKLGFASAASSSSAAPKKKKAAAAEAGKENSENEDAATAVDEAPIATKKKKASSPAKDGKKTKQQSSDKSKADSPNRGSVDDFVGDEDEDEDFLESEAQRQERKARDARAAEDRLAEQKKKQAPAHRRKVLQDDDEDDDDDDDDAMDVDQKKKEKEAVYGEMDYHFNKGGDDDTASNAAGGGGKKEKKKRRKLVEKTSMDDRGFLITEKVWVEEDIPTDEEDNAEGEAGPSPTKKLKSAFGSAAAAPGAAAKKKKPAVKNTKGMKQSGLGAFFGAPKKK